ncbi:MAG: WG repeat-containing protein [Dysgonamonadaceae bacterium]|nr:WG repeat-containing protein [Dysgonamonadaceae bacterium]
MDKNGKKLIPLKYDDAISFTNLTTTVQLPNAANLPFTVKLKQFFLIFTVKLKQNLYLYTIKLKH